VGFYSGEATPFLGHLEPLWLLRAMPHAHQPEQDEHRRLLLPRKLTDQTPNHPPPSRRMQAREHMSARLGPCTGLQLQPPTNLVPGSRASLPDYHQHHTTTTPAERFRGQQRHGSSLEQLGCYGWPLQLQIQRLPPCFHEREENRKERERERGEPNLVTPTAQQSKSSANRRGFLFHGLFAAHQQPPRHHPSVVSTSEISLVHARTAWNGAGLMLEGEWRGMEISPALLWQKRDAHGGVAWRECGIATVRPRIRGNGEHL
jgi:hypothetical protein